MTGRTLFQFNAGTMTSRSATQGLRPTDRLEISDTDAAGLRVIDGQVVRVRSRYGTAVLPIEISSRVDTGTLFATFHDPATTVNRLTSPRRDGHTNTPEYKVTAVRVERIENQTRSDARRG
jgi:formate dehydrogenase major subunit